MENLQVKTYKRTPAERLMAVQIQLEKEQEERCDGVKSREKSILTRTAYIFMSFQNSEREDIKQRAVERALTFPKRNNSSWALRSSSFVFCAPKPRRSLYLYISGLLNN